MTLAVENMPRYDRYKDSGIDWIGEIPEHWEVKKMKNLFHRIQTGTTPTTSNLNYFDGDINWFNPKDLNNNYVTNSEKKVSSLAVKYGEIKMFPSNSILVVGIGATTGKTSYMKDMGTFNQQITGFHSKCHDAEFMYYLISSFSKLMLNVANYTTLPILNNEFFKQFFLSVPPKEEQQAIATFLDKKTAQIDQAINIKEQQITLLKERKQIMIQNAVTKGLDPNVPMKDSGFEWLGSIPEHWEVEKGKWLFKKENRPVQQDDEIITCFRDGEVTLRKNRRTDGFTNALQEIGYQRIYVGDLVIHAMDAFAGAIGVSDSNGKSSPVYSACTPIKDNTVDPYYYAYFLRNLALSGVILSLAKGIRERSTDFRFNDFGALQLSVPPIQEQKAIVSYINTECQKIETGISAQMEQINKFKEYKATLINSAVTGKIKVV